MYGRHYDLVNLYGISVAQMNSSVQLCSVCRNHNPVLSLLMTYHLGCNKNKMTLVPHVKQELLIHHEYLPSSVFFVVFVWFVFCSCCQITGLHVFSSVLWCPLRFPLKKWCSISLDSHLFCRGGPCFVYLIFIFLRILVFTTISISDDVRVV